MSDTTASDRAPKIRPQGGSSRAVSLTEGDVSRHLLRLSIPMIWGILLIIAIQLIDMFYISLLGAQALAAISFTFPVTYGIFSIFMGFAVAMSSVGSRLIGSGEHVQMHRVLFHGFVLVTFFGAVFSFFGYIYAEEIFRLMGAQGGVLTDLLDYMHIWFAGAVFVSLPIIGNAAIRASGDSKMPAYIMAVSAVINFIMDPILIFGWFGFPEMGMKGAALATILSYVGGVIVGLHVMVFKLKILVNPAEFGWFKNFGDSTKRLMVIAVPAGLTSAVQPLLNAFVTALLAGAGAYAVAAYGIVTRVEALLFVPIMAVSIGMSPIVGQNFGAGNSERVKAVLVFALKLLVLWSFISAVFLVVFGKFVAGLFTEDPDIIRVVLLYFLIVPFTFLLGNLIMGWSSMFNALAKPQFSFAISFMRMVVLGAPACWLGAMWGGATGVFIAIAIVNVVSGVAAHLFSWRYLSRC